MGILFMFVLVCLLLYAILVSHGVYFLLKWDWFPEILGAGNITKITLGRLRALGPLLPVYLLFDARCKRGCAEYRRRMEIFHAAQCHPFCRGILSRL